VRIQLLLAIDQERPVSLIRIHPWLDNELEQLLERPSRRMPLRVEFDFAGFEDGYQRIEADDPIFSRTSGGD
jgi:hypothetical protein